MHFKGYPSVADFCRHGIKDESLKPMLYGIAETMVRLHNPDITEEQLDVFRESLKEQNS